MAIKNISLTEEAYKRLARLKKGKESFSDTVKRITEGNDIGKLKKVYGILKEEDADLLENKIKETRKNNKEMHEKRIKKTLGRKK